MKRLIILTAVSVLLAGIGRASAQKPEKYETVTIDATMHCDNCVAKIERSIPFERGVKDIDVEFDRQQVVVRYDASKTDPQKIEKAFEKIKVPAKVADEPEKE